MVRKLVPLIIFIVLVAFLGAGLTMDPRKIPSPLIGKPVPEFTLAQLKDAEQTLSSGDLHGQVSIINVWASWCVGCRVEHKVLLDLARREVANIYGLNFKDQRKDAIDWLNYYGDPYTGIAHDLDGKVGIDFGVYGAPETFVVDRQGIIRYKHIGPLTKEIVEQEVLPLLEELKVASL